MNTNAYINKYQKNQVETASPEQILIMLYNAAINFLNKAKLNLDNNEEELFHHHMVCCKNIIAEFMNTLDVDAGGHWAEVLYSLYKYLRKLVITSDIAKNVEGIDEVLNHLTRLRDTWAQAIIIAKEEQKTSTDDSYQPSDDYEGIDISDDEDEEDE